MQNLPKRKRMRLKEYDYSKFGFYFVTICIKDRKEFFGNVIDSRLVLTKYGKIVDQVLKDLPNYYDVELDFYIIMPDHIHLIIIIDNPPLTNTNKCQKVTTLSDIIGKIKSYSTRKIREELRDNKEFDWQKSFYDRIIRNEKELYNIRKYIEENPLRWEREKNYP